MPLDLSMFKETGFDPSLPGSGLTPGFANEIRKREQLQIAQELQRRMAEEQIANQPVERSHKQALAEQALATARRYDASSTIDNDARYADKLAKAEAERILQKKRNARGMLEGVMSRYDIPGMDSGPELNNLISSGALPESATRFLRSPDGKSSFFTKEALQGAIEHLGQGDPLYMGQRKVETQQAGATQRNTDSIASREKEGAANRENKLALKRMDEKIASDRRGAKNISDTELMAHYLKQAELEPEKQAYWVELAQRVAQLKALSTAGGQTPVIDIGTASGGKVTTQPAAGTPNKEITPPSSTAGGMSTVAKVATLSPEEKDWVHRALQANPNHKIEEIIEIGKKAGKIK